MPCPFCQIAANEAPRSVVYEDNEILAFLDVAPVNLGQCVIIPKAHVDHFTDLSDDIASRMMVVAQHIGRKQREARKPRPRIGHIVHGFGIAHAHLVVIPQYSRDDIKPGKPLGHPERAELDGLAKSLRIFLRIGGKAGRGRRRDDQPKKKAKVPKLEKPKAKKTLIKRAGSKIRRAK